MKQMAGRERAPSPKGWRISRVSIFQGGPRQEELATEKPFKFCKVRHVVMKELAVCLDSVSGLRGTGEGCHLIICKWSRRQMEWSRCRYMEKYPCQGSLHPWFWKMLTYINDRYDSSFVSVPLQDGCPFKTILSRLLYVLHKRMM